MFPLSILVIAAADIPSIPATDGSTFSRELQTILVARFYQLLTPKAVEDLSSKHTLRDYCKWKGITCASGKVTEIYYQGNDYGNFDLCFLPPTLERVMIHHCHQRYAIQTRNLPRALQVCHITHNQLFGSVDLLILPGNLVSLDLSYNQLEGPIDLTNLPRGLERVGLEKNAIRQAIVYYGELHPKIVITLRVIRQDELTNEISEVRALHPENRVKSKKVFRNFPAKHIH